MTLRTTIAAPFRHMRKERLQRSEIIFYLAIDRKWMSRSEAERVIGMACEEGLLKDESGVYTPTFDLGGVTIPIGFRPSDDLFSPRDPLKVLLERIAAARGLPLQEVASEMNRLIEERFRGNIYPEAAAVILARQHGVPTGDLREDLERQIMASGEGEQS
ncbi:MAG: DUF2240 family protein [Methanoculleaceae archaeon]